MGGLVGVRTEYKLLDICYGHHKVLTQLCWKVNNKHGPFTLSISIRHATMKSKIFLKEF